jgi:hypothetical protein
MVVQYSRDCERVGVWRLWAEAERRSGHFKVNGNNFWCRKVRYGSKESTDRYLHEMSRVACLGLRLPANRLA